MKKGFTLIELLAVILILGIIALIAIPQVNNIIEESKENSTKRSAEQYIRAVETTSVSQELKGIHLEGVYSIEDLNSIGVEVKGTKPDSGTVTIKNNEVIACSLTIGVYQITCSDETITLIKGVKVSPTLVEDNNSNGKADMHDKICIDTECFYVISNDNTNIRMLSEWNLNVGYDVSQNGSDDLEFTFNYYDPEYQAYVITATHTKLNPSIIKQDSTKKGRIYDFSAGKYQAKGILPFMLCLTGDDKVYWVDSSDNILQKYGTGSWRNMQDSKNFPYVYDSNSALYPYVNGYVETLKNMTGVTTISGDLIRYEELTILGCTSPSYSCQGAPNYVYQTSYWTGTAYNENYMWIVSPHTYSFFTEDANAMYHFGVRPVITIPTSSIE